MAAEVKSCRNVYDAHTALGARWGTEERGLRRAPLPPWLQIQSSYLQFTAATTTNKNRRKADPSFHNAFRKKKTKYFL